MQNKYNLPENHIFSREEITSILSKCYKKTLGELDKKNVFKRTKTNPKITGIAGDVVEQSILGYKPDRDQRPDILIDDIPYEVKTTGVKYNKHNELEAKEPITITAVSPETICNEIFLTSHFWEKLEHMLLVYYLYDSAETVTAAEYAKFPFTGYELHEFNQKDINVLKADWENVRDFIKYLNDSYEKPKDEYPRLSSELRDKLLYIDTAPKWPNKPRFRLKRTVVSSIVKNYFNKKQECLPEEINSFQELDAKLHTYTELYKDKTVLELLKHFSIPYKDEASLNKAVSEQIIVKMFGGKSKKINNIDLFSKAGIIAKTICVTSKGERTEDMKLFPIDFEEVKANPEFEDTFIFDYFMNHQLLCIVFEEKDENQNFKDNKFKGFKRISFPSEFIENDVKKTWTSIVDIVNNNKLMETECRKKDGSIIKNPIGTVKVELNFPKSAEYEVFVRGGGKDSTDKKQVVNDISMLRQWIWIKGKKIVNILKDKQYI